MKNHEKAKWSILFILISIQSALHAEDNPWKEIKRKNNITIQSREYSGSPIPELKATTELQANLSQIVNLLSNNKSCAEIYYQCKEVVLLSGTANSKNAIVYVRNGAPWPVNDRDVIMNRSFDQNPKSKTVTITLAKTDSISKLSPSGVTRMDSFQAVWKLTPTQNGKISLEYRTHFEPGGSIPESLIKLSLADNPYNTILNLKNATEEGKSEDSKFDWIME
ncbi:polyketide cyclase [Leptospira sp. 'Mane']|uniref:polyketide cyclase n=1 Tax=Leptospira sp. 'Mane' TaxID=3387407 RepID=UPI00398AB79F